MLNGLGPFGSDLTSQFSRVGPSPNQLCLSSSRIHVGKSNLKSWMRDKRGRLKQGSSAAPWRSKSSCTIACLPCWIQLRRCATAGNLECLGYGLALLCLLAQNWHELRKDLKDSCRNPYLRGLMAEDVADHGNDMVYLRARTWFDGGVERCWFFFLAVWDFMVTLYALF